MKTCDAVSRTRRGPEEAAAKALRACARSAAAVMSCGVALRTLHGGREHAPPSFSLLHIESTSLRDNVSATGAESTAPEPCPSQPGRVYRRPPHQISNPVGFRRVRPTSA